ncbi:MAG: SurA N-terminal domain-containing protein, partial [Nitrospinota bacterium]|nr:SurA N-terminal domain-containing protein [Nitrospinota bacterium]
MTALAAALWISPALPARAEITDRIVANVNGAIILLSEVRDQQAILAELREKQGLGLPDEELTESRVLSNMIDEKLAASFAKEKEIEIKEAEVDKAIANIKEKNKIGDDEFRSAIVAQGSTMEKFREQVKNQLLIQRVISMEVDMVNPSEDDAKAFYQQNRSLFVAQGRIKARHILIMVPEDASPAETAQAASRIEEIKKQIDQGADFAQMASQYSADPSAKNGGELGWL